MKRRRLSKRRLAQLHARVVAVIAALLPGRLVVELTVHEHALMLSILDAFELGRQHELFQLTQCLPDWLGVPLERAFDAGEMPAIVETVRRSLVDYGEQIGGAA